MQIKECLAQDLRDFSRERAETPEDITGLRSFEEVNNRLEMLQHASQQIERRIRTQSPVACGDAF